MVKAPLIGGEAHPTGLTQAIQNPWSSETIAEVDFCDHAALQLALKASRSGFEQSRRLPKHKRADILDRMASLVREHQDSLTSQIVQEAGKPVTFARGEVLRCAHTFRRYAEAVRTQSDSSIPLDAIEAGAGRTGIVERFPCGPVLGITPFNFPLNLVAHKVAPAIATGCSFLIKPAEQTPSGALSLGELAVESGYPPQAVNVVPDHREDTSALIQSDVPKVLSFTGSDRVGWALKSQAGRKKVLLELGGNAAALVHHDADLSKAIDRIAMSSMAYAGQVCISVQRVLVHESIQADFKNAFLKSIKNLAVGNPNHDEVVCGPMINAGAKNRVQHWVEEALEKGAVGLTEPRFDAPNNLLDPIVLENVEPHCRIYSEEVFGPVVILETYGSLEEAIHRVNSSRWGLQAGLFTRDIPSLFHAFQNLEVGALLHNDTPTWRVDHMPYGGIKDSGFGREGPTESMRDYTEGRMLAIRWDEH